MIAFPFIVTLAALVSVNAGGIATKLVMFDEESSSSTAHKVNPSPLIQLELLPEFAEQPNLKHYGPPPQCEPDEMSFQVSSYYISFVGILRSSSGMMMWYQFVFFLPARVLRLIFRSCVSKGNLTPLAFFNNLP